MAQLELQVGSKLRWLSQHIASDAEPATAADNSEGGDNDNNDPPVGGNVAGMIRLLNLSEHTFARDAAPVLNDANPDVILDPSKIHPKGADLIRYGSDF
ncbi:predicted protein [Arabidopsis lyrata subsp. lyrata]|uniref:Predicted protein n=1 Tax=Arabidopsis lyrata subsp. lyrata TaxID=81972 RepID=D7MRG8_ARALL|nr:predicted protein [Arabidopsis lyrata subsp. lyrata]